MIQKEVAYILMELCSRPFAYSAQLDSLLDMSLPEKQIKTDGNQSQEGCKIIFPQNHFIKAFASVRGNPGIAKLKECQVFLNRRNVN